MKAASWIIVGAGLCLGVLILTTLLIFFALKRGAQTISREVNKQPLDENALSESAGANTRWARGNLKAAPASPKKEATMQICPACGGENPSESSACSFCGRKL